MPGHHHHKHFLVLHELLGLFGEADLLLGVRRDRVCRGVIIVELKVVAAGCEFLGLTVEEVHALDTEADDEVVTEVELVGEDLVYIAKVYVAPGHIFFLVVD